MTSRTGLLPLSDALFRTLAESTAAAVFIIARDRFQYVNPALATLVDYSVEQLLAIDPYDLVHPESLPEALRRLPAVRSGGSSPRWELRIWTRHRESLWLALVTKVIEIDDDLLVVGVGVDITETKVADARMTHVSDVESASEFTRNLAHDLNDVLQVIQGHTDRLHEGLNAGHPLAASSDGIRDASARAAELARDLLEFSRRLRLQHPEHTLAPPRAVRPVVLLVEDEEPVRALVGDMLERFGFDVVTAASGEEGLQIEEERHIDLLLSDVMLPGRNGFQVASQIRQRSPHVRVLFMSGYTGEPTPSLSGLGPDTPLIQKPFKMAELMTRIREVLGESGGTRLSIPVGGRSLDG